MLRSDAGSGNERMPVAHETTQSVHFGAGALIPLQDFEKEKAAIARRPRLVSIAKGIEP
jgi:hypothetical protein